MNPQMLSRVGLRAFLNFIHESPDRFCSSPAHAVLVPLQITASRDDINDISGQPAQALER